MPFLILLIEFAVTVVFCLAGPVAIVFMLSMLLVGLGELLTALGYEPPKPPSKKQRAKDGYWEYQNVLARAKLSQRKGETAGQAIERESKQRR